MVKVQYSCGWSGLVLFLMEGVNFLKGCPLLLSETNFVTQWPKYWNVRADVRKQKGADIIRCFKAKKFSSVKKNPQKRQQKTKLKPPKKSQLNILDSMNFLKTVYLTGGIIFLDVTISATLFEVFCTAEKQYLEMQSFWSEGCSL